MKKSNELIVLVALLLAAFVVPSLRAQNNPDRPEGPRPRREQMRDNIMKMADDLGLTQDQRAKVKAIIQDSREEGKAVREDESLTPEQKREKADALRKSTEGKINALLTPEQLAKKKELRGAHGGPGGPDGGKPARKKQKKTE